MHQVKTRSSTALRLYVSITCLLVSIGPSCAETFEDGRLEVFISIHRDMQAGNYVLEDEIVEFIGGAERTLDIAMQEIRWAEGGEWPIVDAIFAAARRGVKVRVIVEADYYDEDHAGNRALYERFEAEPNIAPMRDGNSAIFHNKFVIRDAGGENAALLAGSTNFTDTGTRANYNHIVIVHFPPASDPPSYYEMLARYQAEFDEAWSGVFGNHDPSEEPLRCWIGRTYARVYFAPDNDPDDHLLDLLCGARESLDVMVFTFGSSSPLMAGVINRWFTWEHQRARDANAQRRLRVATESQQAQYWSAYPPLLAMGVPVRVERNPHAKLHHKVAVIDEARVILGSYNWTLAANNRNDENLLVLSNREVAGLFTAAFDELWDEVLVAP
ncbi:MAG: phospholipase D-like domain-containing protein [Armatimonadota bacterium]